MRSTPTYDIHEPCPDRFLDDIGTGFAAGAVAGSIFHFIRGVYSSPNGERIFGGAQAIRMNAPRFAGRVAVYSGLFAVCNCSMVYIRQKEDPWNNIAACAAASGLYDVRKGLRYASRSALCGGAFFALLEGGFIMLEKALHDVRKDVRKEREL